MSEANAAAFDPLSDVFHAVRLTGAVFFDFEAKTPFAAEAPPSSAIAPHVSRGAEHAIEFHVITSGSCWGGIVGEDPVRLETGDVIAFPQGDAHVISSGPGMRGPTLGTLPSAVFGRLPIAVHHGPPGAADVRMICGFLTCDRQPFNPLVAALPRLLHDRASRERVGKSGWITQFIDHAVVESKGARVGSQTVLTKLSELMFLDVVRRYLEALPPEHVGWLGALHDPIVGRAIALLHERPAQAWTVDELARASGASRSGLYERFTAAVGMAPMQYLAQWRIQLAANLLARSNAGIAAIASEVGYDSEAAFHRAFKKAVGTAPGAWRRQKAG
ncbi:MAG TPA: AraC family transcriptional regulator [Kofleriaceae bacterium]